MLGGSHSSRGFFRDALARVRSLTGALGVAAGAELWAMGIESISRRKLLFQWLPITGAGNSNTAWSVAFPRFYPMPKRGDADDVSRPSTVTARIEPVGVCTFQILLCAGACRRQRSAALRTTEKKHMSKLFGLLHMALPSLEEKQLRLLFF
jgi:hypothetical protein